MTLIDTKGLADFNTHMDSDDFGITPFLIFFWELKEEKTPFAKRQEMKILFQRFDTKHMCLVAI